MWGDVEEKSYVNQIAVKYIRGEENRIKNKENERMA